MKKIMGFLLVLGVALTSLAVNATGRILNFANLAEVATLDPALAEGVIEHHVIAELFEGLTQQHPKTMVPIAGMAKSWTISPDGKTYIFTLQPNAKWSDGTPVTAYDFAYSWGRTLNPKTGAKYAMMLFPVKNAEEYNQGKITDVKQVGFKAVDAKTFQVELHAATPYFLYTTAHFSSYAVPKQAIDAHKEKWTRAENIVTNGAFHLKKWAPQQEIVVEKSVTYWDVANVRLAGVRFSANEDLASNIKKYKAGSEDVLHQLAPLLVPMLRKEEKGFHETKWLTSYAFMMNVNKAPFTDKRVRQAMRYAIDSDTLANKFLQGMHFPTSSYVPDGLPGYVPAKGLSYDLEKAKALLAEAGFPGGKGLPKITYLYNTSEDHKNIGQVLQQMWKAAGIDVELMNTEWKVYLSRMKSEDYQIMRRGWIGDYPDPNTFLELYTSSSGMNNTGWKNKEYDSLMSKAAVEMDASKRLQYLRDAESLILEEAPIGPILVYGKQFLLRPGIKGYEENLISRHPLKFVYFEDEKTPLSSTTTIITTGEKTNAWQKATRTK